MALSPDEAAQALSEIEAAESRSRDLRPDCPEAGA